MDSQSFFETYEQELRRIGLDPDRSPYGMMASSGSDDAILQFLTHLKTLPAGATWRDVFPDIPKHWDLADEETWTQPYRPLGSYDYATLPCGPAVLVRLPLDSTDADLQQLSTDAGPRGCSIYGSGFVSIRNPDFPHRLAYIVLDVATTEEQYFELVAWIEQHPVVDVAVLSRPVGTQFAP